MIVGTLEATFPCVITVMLRWMSTLTAERNPFVAMFWWSVALFPSWT